MNLSSDTDQSNTSDAGSLAEQRARLLVKLIGTKEDSGMTRIYTAFITENGFEDRDQKQNK